MLLRRGKTKAILDASIDSALLAVEIYNKPRASFRSQAYITLMIIAWTRLFHAYFNNTIGEKYFYKDKKNKRYVIIDGERKAWELSECIKQHKTLKEPVKKNLEFFIKLRNKIEHRHIDAKEVDVSIFGECQSLLFNFENTLIEIFGDNYSINESLVYSLQFSHLRTKGQQAAGKSVLSKDTSEILAYISKFKQSITQEVYESQEYSIKLLNIPKIANNDRNVPAIEFVKWDTLDKEDKAVYEKLVALIKDKKVFIEGANVGKLKAGEVLKKVKESLPAIEFNQATHTAFWKAFAVRPPMNAENPFDTITEFCHYDEPHNDYLYNNDWVNFIVNSIQSGKLTIEVIHKAVKDKVKLEIKEYKIK